MCVKYGLTQSEGHRLRVFENRVLRRIFGPKREEVVGSWRRLHNEELHNLYTSPNIITVIMSRRMTCTGYVTSMVKVRNVYKSLVAKPGKMSPQERPRCRWEGNIRLDLRERGGKDVDWILLAQDRDQWQAHVNTVMNLQVP
jgi:hypothetical protein